MGFPLNAMQQFKCKSSENMHNSQPFLHMSLASTQVFRLTLMVGSKFVKWHEPARFQPWALWLWLLPDSDIHLRVCHWLDIDSNTSNFAFRTFRISSLGFHSHSLVISSFPALGATLEPALAATHGARLGVHLWRLLDRCLLSLGSTLPSSDRQSLHISWIFVTCFGFRRGSLFTWVFRLLGCVTLDLGLGSHFCSSFGRRSFGWGLGLCPGFHRRCGLNFWSRHWLGFCPGFHRRCGLDFWSRHWLGFCPGFHRRCGLDFWSRHWLGLGNFGGRPFQRCANIRLSCWNIIIRARLIQATSPFLTGTGKSWLRLRSRRHPSDSTRPEVTWKSPWRHALLWAEQWVVRSFSNPFIEQKGFEACQWQSMTTNSMRTTRSQWPHSCSLSKFCRSPEVQV